MKRLILTICLCVLFVSSTALADDVSPPSWRGQPGTVTAEWDSWTGFYGPYYPSLGGPMYPDSYSSNPEITTYPPADSYTYPGASLLENFHGRTNVIELTGDQQIEFWLANFYQDPPNPYKEVQIQVTYWALPSQWSSVDAYAYMAEVSEPVFITEYGYGDGWYTDVWNLQIRPNPSSEFIYVNFTTGLGGTEPLYPAYLDQVVIDTYCVPEPATVALLTLGGLAMLRRRNRFSANAKSR